MVDTWFTCEITIALTLMVDGDPLCLEGAEYLMSRHPFEVEFATVDVNLMGGHCNIFLCTTQMPQVCICLQSPIYMMRALESRGRTTVGTMQNVPSNLGQTSGGKP